MTSSSPFGPSIPNWGRIAPARVAAAPSLRAHVLHVPTTLGELRVSLHEFGLRIRSESDVKDYGILCGSTSPLESSVRVTTDAATGATSTLLSAKTAAGMQLELTIGHDPFSFELRHGGAFVQGSSSDGHFVRRFRLPPLARHDGRWLFTFELGAATAVYGLGEKSGRLDKRGQLLRSFNHDALGLNAEWSYKNVPFAWSPDGWGIFVHTPAPVTHGVGYGPWSQRAYALVLEDDALDIFVFTGMNGAAQIARYTELTGRAPVPPDWSLGIILSRAYYKDSAEILAVAREVRSRGMPCESSRSMGELGRIRILASRSSGVRSATPILSRPLMR